MGTVLFFLSIVDRELCLIGRQKIGPSPFSLPRLSFIPKPQPRDHGEMLVVGHRNRGRSPGGAFIFSWIRALGSLERTDLAIGPSGLPRPGPSFT